MIGVTGTVLRVGYGRGFVVATETDRYVITAAHCLSENIHYRYPTLSRFASGTVSPLDGGSPTAWAKCVFFDSVIDLAVLAEHRRSIRPQYSVDEVQPDDAYQQLIGEATPFRLAKLRLEPQPEGPPMAESDALMLSLAGEWFPCRIQTWGRSLWIEETGKRGEPGMSGSPVILPDGRAVGVACRGNSPNPLLADNLPAWLVHAARRPRVLIEE